MSPRGFSSSSSSSAAADPAATGAMPPELSDLHCFTETSGVITTTMFDVPGYRVVKILGAVYGLTVRTRNWAAALGMVMKSVAGGELRWFTNLLYSARNDAIGRIVHECQSRGGNAVIALRFDAGEIGGGYAQVCAYGTAALIEKIDPELPGYDHPQLFPASAASAAAAGVVPPPVDGRAPADKRG